MQPVPVRRKATSQAQVSVTLLSNIRSCDDWVNLTTEKDGCLLAPYFCVKLRDIRALAESLLAQVLSLKPTLPLDTSALSILCWQKDLPPPLGTGNTDFRKTAVISVRASHKMGCCRHTSVQNYAWELKTVCADESRRFCHQEKKVDKMLSQYK